MFSATYGDVQTIPSHITAALLEERYGKYLDQAESLVTMPATMSAMIETWRCAHFWNGIGAFFGCH